MSQWYKLTFKQLQPINLGYKKHGVINETRIFITGQSIWGALTNAYFKDSGEYNETLFENITCFYPKIEDGEVLSPEYKYKEDGEFYLGKMSEREFRYEFVTTYLSTAVNPNSLNAKDESLHEIDVVLPQDKEEKKHKEEKKQLFWVGYLKIDKDIEIPKEIYIGSDSRYGLGLMKLEDKSIEENFNYEVVKGKYNNDYPKNEPISNFVEFDNQEFIGELELLAEFDFSENRPKVKQNSSAFYITVGSSIND